MAEAGGTCKIFLVSAEPQVATAVSVRLPGLINQACAPSGLSFAEPSSRACRTSSDVASGADGDPGPPDSVLQPSEPAKAATNQSGVPG